MLPAIHLTVALLFLLLSIVFFLENGAWLITGYNTASAAEKAALGEKVLRRFMGKVMLVLPRAAWPSQPVIYAVRPCCFGLGWACFLPPPLPL